MCIRYKLRRWEISVRANIVIDDHLLKEAFSVSQGKTKKEVIHETLKKTR
jgi:Arc/MetJ family transcription regulator